jgi:hypothetical protein
VNRIVDIWRGEPYPRHLHLLDNDFFGQPREQWQARIGEIKAGGFRVCFNQGINTRMIDDEAAAALASIPLYDDSFTRRRLYTAWDNLGDEERFFRGVDTLERHGIYPHSLLVYMLIGYDRKETWERVLYRFRRMTERGIRPFPMIYGLRDRTLPLGHAPTSLERRTLAQFQRWAIRRYYTVVDFAGYDVSARDRGTEPRRRCKHCLRSLAAGARSDARFCSESCRNTHFRRQARLQRGRSKCQSCRKPIPRQSRADACYCSCACRQLAYRGRILSAIGVR